MNGKGQFWMNVGITLMLGAYGVISAFYSEMLKPQGESSGKAIALDLIAALALTASAIQALKAGYIHIKKDRELPH